MAIYWVSEPNKHVKSGLDSYSIWTNWIRLDLSFLQLIGTHILNTFKLGVGEYHGFGYSFVISGWIWGRRIRTLVVI